MKAKAATQESTEKFAARFSGAAKGHFRKAQDLTVSSLGIGTYLGNWDSATDQRYTDAVEKYVESGGNVIDTAANYRFQRSERNIGDALANLAEKGFERDEIVICTKGGYLPFDGEPPSDVRAYFEENFVKTGIATFDDLAGGSHCMAPGYLQSQIEQSLKNMNIDSIDVYYIHNPESQLSAVDKGTFELRLSAAFELLEKMRSQGKLKYYGAATWNGFRVAPQEAGYHSLEKMVNIARQVGGADHGFKFVQLPFNLMMPEAYLLNNQAFDGKAISAIEAAKNLGISVMASASILQGKLSANLPENLRKIFGNLKSDAQTSLQFVRSTPGISAALVGMSDVQHVEENMKLSNVEPASEEDFQELFTK